MSRLAEQFSPDVLFIEKEEYNVMRMAPPEKVVRQFSNMQSRSPKLTAWWV
jgi:hypothetical protein